MNITLIDLFKFLKKNIIFAIFIFLISGSSYYGYFNLKSKGNIFTFQVDLREWKNLNSDIFPWLQNYKKYPNEIKYALISSFNSGTKCKSNESVTDVLFCSAVGPKDKLNENFIDFKNRAKFILNSQLKQIDNDLIYFEGRKQRAEDFLIRTSEIFRMSGENSKLADYNYSSFNKIAQMENDIEVLKQVRQNFRGIRLVKSAINQALIFNNVLFYSLMCSFLCLILFVIFGVAIKSSKKSK